MKPQLYFRAASTLAFAIVVTATAYSKPAPQDKPTAPPAVAPAAASAPPAAQPVQQEAFYVVGLTIHTSTTTEAKGDGQIPALWQRFMEQDIASTIPDRVGTEIYVVYTDYDPGKPGEYTYLLGAKVSSIGHVPAGMVAKQVPAGRYSIVPSEKGPLQEVIPAVWVKIWQMTPEQLGGKRAHKADFEVYDFSAMDPQNGQVDVHVGVE